MITFFAPPSRCLPALSLLANSPVHSSTTSTPRSPQGSRAGVPFREHRDPVAVDHEVVAVDFDLAGEAAVGGVVAGEMGVGLGVAEIVDRHDPELVGPAALVEGAEDVPSDASETVDAYFDGHVRSSVRRRIRISAHAGAAARATTDSTVAATFSAVRPKCS